MGEVNTVEFSWALDPAVFIVGRDTITNLATNRASASFYSTLCPLRWSLLEWQHAHIGNIIKFITNNFYLTSIFLPYLTAFAPFALKSFSALNFLSVYAVLVMNICFAFKTDRP